ncbi:MAG: hypothetical protein JHC87_00190 [Thermoleophilaceae bacterium]|nr:hypothetical protein [Thermoleophilaceae bacterium]
MSWLWQKILDFFRWADRGFERFLDWSDKIDDEVPQQRPQTEAVEPNNFRYATASLMLAFMLPISLHHLGIHSVFGLETSVFKAEPLPWFLMTVVLCVGSFCAFKVNEKFIVPLLPQINAHPFTIKSKQRLEKFKNSFDGG